MESSSLKMLIAIRSGKCRQEKTEKVRGVLKQLLEEAYQIVADYMVTTNLIAQKECEYLYVQVVKDCVALLKKLGVI